MIIISGKRLKTLMANMNALAENQRRLADSGADIESHLRSNSVDRFTMAAYIVVGAFLMVFMLKKIDRIYLNTL